MAIEDNFHELYALYVANTILCARLWGYLASLAAKAEGVSEKEYIERQRQLSVQSVDLWKFQGHRNPDQLKRLITARINEALTGIIAGAPSGSRLQ